MHFFLCSYRSIKLIYGEFCQPRNLNVETTLFPTKIRSDRSFIEIGFTTSKSQLLCYHHCSITKNCNGNKFDKLKLTRNCALYSKHDQMSNGIQNPIGEDISTLVKV